MKAIVCREYGQPEDLVFDELPSPAPGPGQIAVRVRAAAVNFPDVLLIGGKYQVRIPVPFIPGSELAGEVLAVGDGVSGFDEGDRVFGTVMVGAFAEEVVVETRRGTVRIVGDTIIAAKEVPQARVPRAGATPRGDGEVTQ